MPALVDRILGRAPSVQRIAAAAGSPPVGRSVAQRDGTEPGRGRWGASLPLATDEALDATPLSVQQIFEEAARGRTSRLIDLYKHSRPKDSALDSVCATRVHAISGRPYVVRPPPGLEQDPMALEVAARVTTVLNETPQIEALKAHLAHGVLEHLAVLQHRWSRDRRGWWVTRPEWAHPNRFGWRLPDIAPTWSQYEPGLDETGKSVAGRPLSDWPDRFVVFTPVGGRSDYPWMRGAMRSRVAPSVIKRLGVRFWIKVIERWGQPQVYAERPPDLGTADDATVDDQLIKALRSLGSDWRATVPAGTKFNSIPVQVAEKLHENFVDHQNRQDQIAILGQNLSTEIAKGGSYAAAKAHQYVRLDLLAGDLVELAECITDQWVEPLCRFNGWAPVPVFDFILGWREPITVQEYQAGLFTADEVRGSKGHEPKPGGSGRAYYAGQAAASKTITVKPTGQPDADPIEVDVEDMEGSDVAKEAASNAATVSDLAFNGAQVQALQGMIAGVATELAPRAVELALTTAFPAVDDATAAEMVRSQATFVAAKKPAPEDEAT